MHCSVDHERIVLHRVGPPVHVMVIRDGDTFVEVLSGASAGAGPLTAHLAEPLPAGARRLTYRFREDLTAEKLQEYSLAGRSAAQERAWRFFFGEEAMKVQTEPQIQENI